MEMDGKKVNLDFVDSLFEELNEKVEADNLYRADASCGGASCGGCSTMDLLSTNCTIQLPW